MDEEVVSAMLPYFRESYGNPSSVHSFGREIKAMIAESREIIATAIDADPSEVYFTSGGTEADNIAIKGFTAANRKGSGGHIITSTIEHPAVLETCKYLSKNGFDLTKVGVDGNALVDLAALRDAIRDNTILISIMHANNETGTVEPIEEIVKIGAEKNVAVHTDAVQSFLKIPFSVKKLGVDMASFSAHKIGGPKGVGLLYLKKGIKIHPLTHGGHHEKGVRAGTENVAGIAGFAKAVELGVKAMEKKSAHVRRLRDELQKRITETIPYVRINGDTDKRLPGTVNISFECVEGEALLINLDMAGIAISTGSACSSGSLDPSHVLMAMGIAHEVIHGSLRFSFGAENSMDDVDYVMTKLPQIIGTVRKISPLWDSHKNVPITLEQAAKGAGT